MTATAIALKLLAVLLLIALNGFFVAAEFALVSVRQTRIDQMAESGAQLARILQRAKANPTRFLLAAQIGITVASLALGWIAEPTIAALIVAALAAFHEQLGLGLVHGVATAITFTLVTFMHIVLGENIPKAIALQRTERTALAIALPMEWLAILMKPFISALDRMGAAVMHLFGLPNEPIEHAAYTPEEIKRIVATSHELGVLEAQDQELVERVFAFGDKVVREVMVPRLEMKTLDAQAGLDEVLEVVERSGHTRLPVYEDTIDNVIGVLHVRDLLSYLRRGGSEGAEGFALAELVTEVLYVPENKPLGELLRDFQGQRMAIAIVMDEYGGTAGMAMLEDLVEEIVGGIQGEWGEPEAHIEPLGPSQFLVDGRVAIADFNARFGTELPTDAFDTVAGWVFGQLGREAELGDTVVYQRFRFQVDVVDGHRIASLLLEETPEPRPQAAEEPAEGLAEGPAPAESER